MILTRPLFCKREIPTKNGNNVGTITVANNIRPLYAALNVTFGKSIVKTSTVDVIIINKIFFKLFIGNIYVKDIKIMRKVGLALGAGSARGLAHLGVLRALGEHGVKIDMVSGCSMGAVVGAMYVTGSNMEMFQKLITNMEMKQFLDVRVSLKGIVRGERTLEILRMFTKEKKFEDLEIPFSCIALDVQNGQKKVFDSGYIYPAVRASISIPGVFSPYEHMGRTYIDGGMIERTPIQTLRNMGADFIIACDVAYKGEELGVPNNALSTINQTISLMGWEIAKRQIFDADVLLLPNVLHINARSNAMAEECIEIGYQTTIAAIPEIKEKLKG